MKPHLRYASYVIRHKWFVFRAGLKTRAPIWRLIVHDWSKMTPAEWTPYVQTFYTNHGDPEAFDRAWLHHQHRNPHHWQHWLLREDDGQLKVLSIPESLVREMVADWMGAGRAITGRWEVRKWYEGGAATKMVLHDGTRALVEALIAKVA